MTRPRNQGRLITAHRFNRPVTTSAVAASSALTRLAIAKWGPAWQQFGGHLNRSSLSSRAPLLPLELGLWRRCFARMAGSGDVQKYNVVFVLGGPGAGKGTQCQMIEEVIRRLLLCQYKM